MFGWRVCGTDVNNYGKLSLSIASKVEHKITADLKLTTATNKGGSDVPRAERREAIPELRDRRLAGRSDTRVKGPAARRAERYPRFRVQRHAGGSPVDKRLRFC